MTIWTAGFGVPDLAARSGLSTDAVGRLLTDETLTSVDDERIVAAGDSAAPSDLPFRMSCQAAASAGRAGRRHGAAPDRRRGARARQRSASSASASAWVAATGSSSSPTATTRARPTYLGGRPGARLKELVCWSTVKQLTWEARRPGTYFLPGWAADGTRTARVKAQHSAALVS